MRIKRVKRIEPAGVHSFFLENEELWKQLNAGKEIEIPDDLIEEIKAVFGASVEVVDDSLEGMLDENSV